MVLKKYIPNSKAVELFFAFAPLWSTLPPELICQIKKNLEEEIQICDTCNLKAKYVCMCEKAHYCGTKCQKSDIERHLENCISK